jgi:hypothetical protein
MQGRPPHWSRLNVIRSIAESLALVTRTVNRFATALSGLDLDNPATVRGRMSGTVVVPRIVGPIWRRPAGRGA